MKKPEKGEEDAKATSRDLQRYDVHRTGGYRITTTRCVLLADVVRTNIGGEGERREGESRNRTGQDRTDNPVAAAQIR